MLDCKEGYAMMKATLFELVKNVQKQYKYLDTNLLNLIGLEWLVAYHLVAVSELQEIILLIWNYPQQEWEADGLINYQYVGTPGIQVIVIKYGYLWKSGDFPN